MEHLRPVVIDNGSGVCKAGFAGEADPTIIFPNCIGRVQERLRSQGHSSYVGNEAQSRRGILTITHPVEHGSITNWHDIAKIWNYLFKELNVNITEHPVFITEPPFNSNENREKIAQLIFETFKAPAIYYGIPGKMSIFGAGRTTGVVVDSGEGVTHTLAVNDGHIIPHSIHRMDIAGNDITIKLNTILRERGCSLDKIDLVREIKEKLCYIPLNYNKQFELIKQSNQYEGFYELPDGQVLSLDSERFRCPEILFQPSIFGSTNIGVHEMIYNSIVKSDEDNRKQLLDNIVVSGGSSLFPGFPERVRKEISGLIGFSKNICVVDPPNRENLVWIGSSIVASLQSFSKMWITRQEYQEQGVRILTDKNN